MALSSTLRPPRQLYILFFTEMWERFSFYGMKALLLAYMVTQLNVDEPRGYAILGSYGALVYTMPMFGGLIADRFLGYRRSIMFGGILMVIGHLVMALPMEWSLFYGMAFIICGNGFFKPNISSLVGTLYEKNDPRKDIGFSFFYMGINAGAALGGLVCGYIGQRINWHYGFGLAAIFMILGLSVFYLGKKSLGQKGLPPNVKALRKPYFGFIPAEWLIYGGTLAVIPLVAIVFNAYGLMKYIMFGLGFASLSYILSIAVKMEKEGRLKLFAAFVMISFSVLFWAFYGQIYGSLNLFAIRNVDMQVMGLDLPPLSVNNFLPPAWVILLSALFAKLWSWLYRKGQNPSTPLKFSLSFILMAAGFCSFWLACKASAATGLIPLWSFVLGYFFIICGELCISPIGLSMITRLSPNKIVGLVMGTWFFATAIGEFLASIIGATMSVPRLAQHDPVAAMPYYETILLWIALGAAATGVILLALVPTLKRWMNDVN